MKFHDPALGRDIERLLADPAYDGHPLREALARLWQHTRGQSNRLDRITDLSDAYQAMALERERDMNERFEHQLKRVAKVARLSDRYQKLMRERTLALQETSYRDPLTNLYNRRLLLERIKQESEQAQHPEDSYSLAMMDLDHFKQVNDTYGHEAGDLALVEVARAILGAIRDYDVCGRWGGEEFLLLLPKTGLAQARSVVARIERAVLESPVLQARYQIPVTLSIGIATYTPGERFSTTIERADRMLYLAKASGRNRVATQDDSD